jgi:hypothetical protein
VIGLFSESRTGLKTPAVDEPPCCGVDALPP